MGANVAHKVMEMSKQEYIKVGDVNIGKNGVCTLYANTYIGNIYNNGSGFKYY